MLLRRLTQHVVTQNWTAVALDFAVVVVGVGFALFAEQWIRDGQKRADLAGAERNLNADLYANYFNAKERLALRACRIASQRALGERLLEPGPSWTPVPRDDGDLAALMAFPTVLRSPNRNWGSRIWEAELTRGTFNQFSAQRRTALDSLFNQANGAEDLQRRIHDGEARLNVLALATELSATERLHYLDLLTTIDRESFWLETYAAQIIAAIETVGFEMDATVLGELPAFLDSYNAAATDVYGECRQPVEMPFILESTNSPSP